MKLSLTSFEPPPWVGKLLSAGAVNAVGTLGQLACILLLGRYLSESDYGELHAVLAWVATVASVALLGQTAAAARELAGRKDDSAQWHSYARLTAFRSLAATVGLCGGIYVVFGLPMEQVLVISGAGYAFGVTQFFSAGVLRGGGQLVRAMAIQRGWALVVLLLSLLSVVQDFRTAAAALLVGHGLMALVAWKEAVRWVPSGDSPIGNAPWLDGVWFWFTNVTMIVGRNLDRLVLTVVVPADALGAYGAVVTLLAGFDAFSFTLGFFLMPLFAKSTHPSVMSQVIHVSWFTALVAGAYLFVGDWVLNVLFDGRYDEAADAIPVLVLAGVAKVFYAIPSSLMGGRLNRAALRRFAMGNLFVVILAVLATWYCALRWGIGGAAWGCVCFWGARLAWAVVVVKVAQEKPELS